MALFSNEGTPNVGAPETIIGQSVKVEGNFRGEGNITVDGEVQGSIKTNQNLSVGPTARIKAEVEASNLFLAGEIRGNIKVREKAQLKSTAKVFGNIETKILSVEEGAIIHGRCTMAAEQAPIEVAKKPIR